MLTQQGQPKIGQFLKIVSKIVNFHLIDLKLEEHFSIRSLNSTTYYFVVIIGQKVNIVQVSKIDNFHPIDLKF